MLPRSFISRTVWATLGLSLSFFPYSSAFAQDVPGEDISEEVAPADAVEGPTEELENSTVNTDSPDADIQEEVEEPLSEESNEETPLTETVADEEALYQNLETYLNDQSWEAADNETFNLLLALVGPESEQQGYFSFVEWEAFVADKDKSCSNVQRIDELWQAHSNGNLGFSAQKRAFETALIDTFSNPDPGARARRFYSLIGWIDIDARKTQVAWERNQESSSADDAVVYTESGVPNFENALETTGYLPAIMYWEAPDGETRGDDRRLELFFGCDEL